jgi:hypothetical protein
MIDSVLGVYQVLGQVLYLNVSHNRLESICGLERLPALERVDLRNNVIEESAEVGRLATLPNIAQVWVEGNPFVEIEEDYRIRCFDYFWKERRSITLDNSPPSFYEKRYLTEPVTEQITSLRDVSSAPSPPVVAVGKTHVMDLAKPSSPAPSSPTSVPTSPRLGATVQRGRRKNKRIVDFDGGEESAESGTARSTSREVGNSSVAKDAFPAAEQKTVAPISRSKPDPFMVASTVMHPKRLSRHGRHHTEANASIDVPEDLPSSSTTGSLRASRLKGATRKARASASVYEPPSKSNEESGKDQQKDAEAFRARIEALRADMGEGWLKVLNQSQLGSPPLTSG